MATPRTSSETVQQGEDEPRVPDHGDAPSPSSSPAPVDRVTAAYLADAPDGFRTLFERNFEAVYALDLEGRFTAVNRSCETIAGYAAAEMLGRPFLPLVAPEHRQRTLEAFTQALAGLPQYYEHDVIRKDGRRITVRESKLPIVVDGRVVGLYGIAADVTTRVRLEREQRMLAEISRALAATLDYQRTLRVIVEMSVDGFADGAHVDVLDAEDGVPRHGVAHNRSDGRAALHALRERYPLRLDDALDPIAAVARTGRPFFLPVVAEEWLRSVARDADHLALLSVVCRQSLITVPLLVRDRTVGVLSFCRDEGSPPFSAHDLDFAERLATQAAAAVENSQLYRRSQAELAERRQVEAALRQSKELFSVAFRSSPNTIAISRLRDGVIVDANDRWLEMLGYVRAEVVGRSQFELGTPEEAVVRREFMARMARDGRVDDYELTYTTRGTGERRTSLLSAEVVPLWGEPHVLAIGRDVTAQRALEAQLRQSQKMEAVGRLAGGVAHDFNNLLTVILSYTELLVQGLAADDERRADADQVRRAAEQAAGLTRQLLAFSRKQVLHPAAVDLNAVVRDTETLLRRVIGADVRLEVELAACAAVVRADRGQLEQVLMNLAVNARDAMPDGGALTLRTRDTVVEPAAAAAMPAALGPGPYVELEVRDTGIGMDAATSANAFEPFFTTKALGQGTGLGLSTVYGIVQQSGGHIAVESEPGVGTAFRLLLPVLACEAEPEVVAPRLAADASAPLGRVLVVEDEESVRRLTERVLRRAGYEVRTAADGDEALAMLHDASVPRPDVLLTDVVMPGMGGRELVRRLAAEGIVGGAGRPRVLFMSGYAGADDRAREDVATMGAFLQKPFTTDALLGAVRSAIAAAT